ncbi:MAG: hypothetical protein GX992_10165 [Clostridium sp.]|nr:hypothetical protein [Clostridium sp.]
MDKNNKEGSMGIPPDVNESDRMEKVPHMEQILEAQPMPQMGVVPPLDIMPPQQGSMPGAKQPQMMPPMQYIAPPKQPPQMQPPQMQPPQMQPPQGMPPMLCCPLVISIKCPFAPPEHIPAGQGMAPCMHTGGYYGAGYCGSQYTENSYPCDTNMYDKVIY